MPTLFMLADNYVESKLQFPVVVQPKYDGVRAGNLDGMLTGRSLKKHKNKFTTQRFSGTDFLGLDGELAATDVGNPDLCRLTTSAVNTIEGRPRVQWHLFDYITQESMKLGYTDRYCMLIDVVYDLNRKYFPGDTLLFLVPGVLCETLEQVQATHARNIAAGYEGSILRKPDGMYKQGRSTVLEGGLLRIKDFDVDEAVVVSIIEGETNMNEAKLDARGRTERSTHAENMVPNGMVGAMMCRDVKSGEMIKVSAGRMTHDERKVFFDCPRLLVGKTIKYQHFTKGKKDLPRFPTFQSIRADSDIGSPING